MIVSPRLGKAAQSVTLGRDANSGYKLYHGVTSVSLIGRTVDFGSGMATAASVPNAGSSYAFPVDAGGTSGQSGCTQAINARKSISSHPSRNDPFNY
jgi:hypothetical protein